MKKLLGVTVLALVVVLGGAPNALADDTLCPPDLTGVTVDNVIVTGLCRMSGTTVRGNVKVVRGGSLLVFGSATTIHGNLQSDFGDFLQFADGPVLVMGDLQIKGATASSGYNPGVVTIRGNLQYEESSGFLAATGGVIGGNLQMSKNTGGGLITGNTIFGNLQCKENSPPPSSFGISANAVVGNKEDQCGAALGF